MSSIPIIGTILFNNYPVRIPRDILSISSSAIAIVRGSNSILLQRDSNGTLIESTLTDYILQDLSSGLTISVVGTTVNGINSITQDSSVTSVSVPILDYISNGAYFTLRQVIIDYY